MLLLNYARALVELGRLNEAADYAERAHGKAQTGGDNVAVNQSLLVRSSIYRGQGDLERAARMLSEVESTLRRSVPPGHIALASLASQRALLAQARGELQSALDLANESVATAEALMKQGRESSSYLPMFLARRAEIQLQLGRREEARSDAARAVKMFEAIQPGTFSAHLGRAYLSLGRSLSALGKDGEADAPFRAAVEQMQSALGPDHAETRSARQLAEK
jgi:tetratricopeptide (TPR) repeat protein